MCESKLMKRSTYILGKGAHPCKHLNQFCIPYPCPIHGVHLSPAVTPTLPVPWCKLAKSELSLYISPHGAVIASCVPALTSCVCYLLSHCTQAQLLPSFCLTLWDLCSSILSTSPPSSLLDLVCTCSERKWII